MTAEHNNNQRAGEEAQDREGEGGEGNDMEESTDNNQRNKYLCGSQFSPVMMKE